MDKRDRKLAFVMLVQTRALLCPSFGRSRAMQAVEDAWYIPEDELPEGNLGQIVREFFDWQFAETTEHMEHMPLWIKSAYRGGNDAAPA